MKYSFRTTVLMLLFLLPVVLGAKKDREWKEGKVLDLQNLTEVHGTGVTVTRVVLTVQGQDYTYEALADTLDVRRLRKLVVGESIRYWIEENRGMPGFKQGFLHVQASSKDTLLRIRKRSLSPKEPKEESK